MVQELVGERGLEFRGYMGVGYGSLWSLDAMKMDIVSDRQHV